MNLCVLVLSERAQSLCAGYHAAAGARSSGAFRVFASVNFMSPMKPYPDKHQLHPLHCLACSEHTCATGSWVQGHYFLTGRIALEVRHACRTRTCFQGQCSDHLLGFSGIWLRQTDQFIEVMVTEPLAHLIGETGMKSCANDAVCLFKHLCTEASGANGGVCCTEQVSRAPFKP